MREKITNHWKNKIARVDEQDRRLYEIAMDVPKTNKVIAIICFVINFLVSGLGTVIASLATQGATVPKAQLAIASMQFLTAEIYVGWIASILWGWLIILRAWDYYE